MSKVIMRFGPGGSVRAIHDDDFDFKAIGCDPPRRASNVEPIQTGPCASLWYVDMSPLGEAFQYCLWPPFATRREALEAEHAHIIEKWIYGNNTGAEQPKLLE